MFIWRISAPAKALLLRWRIPHRMHGGIVMLHPAMADKCWLNCYDLLRSDDASPQRQLEYRKLMFEIDTAHQMDSSKAVAKYTVDNFVLTPPYVVDPFMFEEVEEFL